MYAQISRDLKTEIQKEEDIFNLPLDCPQRMFFVERMVSLDPKNIVKF